MSVTIEQIRAAANKLSSLSDGERKDGVFAAKDANPSLEVFGVQATTSGC